MSDDTPTKPTLVEVMNMPEPMLDDNFDLHRVDCDPATAKVLAPYLRELCLSLRTVAWTIKPQDPTFVAFGHLVEERPHILSLSFFDSDVSQEVLDARAAFFKPLKAIVLCQFDQCGKPARYVVFEDVITESVKTKLNGAGGQVVEKKCKLLAVRMSFKTVNEYKEYPGVASDSRPAD